VNRQLLLLGCKNDLLLLGLRGGGEGGTKWSISMEMNCELNKSVCLEKAGTC
jgi:hypothetical protein